jgi:hypothetical protein
MAGTIEKSLLAVALFALALPNAGGAGAWTVAPKNHRDNPNRCVPRKGVGSNRRFSRHELASRRRQATGEGGNEPDAAKRQLTSTGGATIDESLYKYDAAEMSYSYRIDAGTLKVTAKMPPAKVLLALKAYQRGEKRGGYQGWKLSRAEPIRPRLVITIQPRPRLSIDFTMPAPGMISPGATSIEPRGLSTRATPL